MWTFKSIDNGKKIYTMKRHSGHVVTIAVPIQHHNDVTAQAYVEAVCAGHDHAIENPAKKPNIFKRMFGKK